MHGCPSSLIVHDWNASDGSHECSKVQSLSMHGHVGLLGMQGQRDLVLCRGFAYLILFVLGAEVGADEITATAGRLVQDENGTRKTWRGH